MTAVAAAPSPFLAGTNVQYVWDSTSLGWLKECPRKYYYHMVLGLTSKGESVHLKFGIWFHQAIELYHKMRQAGQNHNDAVHTVVHESLKATWGPDGPWESDHPLKHRPNLIRAIIWYLDHFENDPTRTIVLENGKPAVELSFKMEMNFGPKASPLPYMLSGHLDRVVEFNEGNFVLDCKTTTTTPGTYYFDQYEPDNQMSIYTIAAKVVFNTPVRGVIIDAVQIAVGFTRTVRGMTYRTQDQIDEWLKDFEWWAASAERYAEADYWPMNDKSCHKYGGCPFRKVCSKSPSVRDMFLASDYERRPWNPLEVR